METTPPPKQAAVWKPPQLRLLRWAGTASGTKGQNDANVWEGHCNAPSPQGPAPGYRMPTSADALVLDPQGESPQC